MIWLKHTSDGVGAGLGWDGLQDGVVTADSGCGLYQEARDGIGLGAPGQSDRAILQVGDANTARGTDVCKMEAENCSFHRWHILNKAINVKDLQD